jgi:hypothetical protein
MPGIGNPSTVWTQLSAPNQPAGAIPFVYTDNYDIQTDVLNFFYAQASSTLSGSLQNYQLTVFGGLRVGYSDTTAAPGAATINKPAGRIKIAAGQTSAVITCSYAFATSIIDVRLEGAFDATAQRVQVTSQGAGTFTVTLNAAATAAVTLSFNITNVF